MMKMDKFAIISWRSVKQKRDLMMFLVQDDLETQNCCLVSADLNRLGHSVEISETLL